MRFDLVSIFPGMLDGPLDGGVIGRARQGGRVDVRLHDLRDFADPPRRAVDDQPYGGGAGMVFRIEPMSRAVEALRTVGSKVAVVWTTPAGEVFNQALARELAEYDQVVILCDRYEGTDARLAALVTHEISIGDYVLTGGELAALVLVDAVARAAGGVVGDAESVAADSFASGLLDHRAYTRPPGYRGQTIPEVMASGHHGEVSRFRRRDGMRRTLERRPDLLDGAPLPRPDAAVLSRERLGPETASPFRPGSGRHETRSLPRFLQ